MGDGLPVPAAGPGIPALPIRDATLYGIKHSAVIDKYDRVPRKATGYLFKPSNLTLPTPQVGGPRADRENPERRAKDEFPQDKPSRQ